MNVNRSGEESDAPSVAHAFCFLLIEWPRLEICSCSCSVMRSHVLGKIMAFGFKIASSSGW